MKRKIAAGITAVALAVGGLMWATPAMAEEVADAPPVAVVEAPAVEAVTTEVPATAPEEAPAVAPETSSEEGPATFTYDKKVWVCKYVGTPFVDERLKDGKNPIEVSVNTLKGFDGTFPWEFADEHGQSIAVKFAKYSDEDVECPEPRVPVKVTPPTPAFEDPCGVNNLTVGTPQTAGIVWSVNQIGNKTKVAATAAEGYVLEGTTTWEFTDSGVLCPPTNVVCEANEQGPLGTNLNGIWTNVDTRSAGHFQYVAGGLSVWTDDASSNAKVSLGTSANFALSQSGEFGINWVGSTPPPGINLFVDFDNDGSIDGTLVFETVYGQDLWLTNGSKQFVKDAAPSHTGGNGSENHGTINEWLTVYPNAQVKGIAFSLGSGVHGAGVIKSLTIGCKVYTFDYKEPVTDPEPEVVTLGLPSYEDVCGTEDDGGSLPEDTEGVHYNWQSDDPESAAYWYVRATVEEGYVVEDVPEGWEDQGEGVYVYAFTMTDEACDTPTPTPTPTTPAPVKPATPASLAATGGGDMAPIVPLAAGIVTMLGLALVVARRFARR